MKRRSTRPFTVEIKQARVSRTSANVSISALHSAHAPQSALLPAFEVDAIFRKPEPLPSPKPSLGDSPKRRVLPCLVPMYELSSEPEPRIATAEAHSLRVRRPRIRSERVPAVTEPDSAPMPIVPRVAVSSIATEAKPRAIEKSAVLPPQSQISRPERVRMSRDKLLGPGDRWKRRLPRILQ